MLLSAWLLGGTVLLLVVLTFCVFCVVCCMRKQTGGKFGPANIQEATGQFDEDHVLIRTRHGIVFKAILQVWRTFAMPFSLSVFFLGLGLSDGILLYRMGP
jgi:hypothetical protein